MTQKRDAAWLAGLWALATAYNLTKPYHIDDAAHLFIAQWIALHPLHPMRGLLNWTGTPLPISATNQPHLYFYALAAWGSLFGWSEVAMHALQSVFTGACILLMYRLARRLVPRQALFLTAMLALNPAFFVEQNLMVDVPLLSFWLGFFAALLEGRFGLAGLACAGALLIKYSSLCLLPILGLAAFAAGQLWCLCIPLGALAAWSGFNLWDYGGVHLLTGFHSGAASYAVPVHKSFPLARRLVKSVIAWDVAVGALSPFGILAAVRGKWPYTILVAGFVALGLGVAFGVVPDVPSDHLLWLGFAISGVAGLALLRRPTDRAGRILWLWVVITSAFYVLLAPCIAARHVLLILPALALLAGRGRAISGPAQVFGIGMSAVLSLGLGLSDYRFAAFHRNEATAIAASFPGQRVTVAGHWGWQYYAAQHGMAELDTLHPPPPGSILAVPREVDHTLPPGLKLRLLRTDTANLSALDPLCTARPSRFYLSYTFRGPWSLSAACTQTTDIFAVR